MIISTRTRIKKVTSWIYNDSNEKFSHLEIYFDGQGKRSFRGLRGTKLQIAMQLGFDASQSFEKNIDNLIGKKVTITVSDQAGWISDMTGIEAADNGIFKAAVELLLRKAAVFFLQ